MLTGIIRSHEKREFHVEAGTLEGIQDAIKAQLPEGWELLSAPVSMPKGSATLKATATIVNRNEQRTVEAADMDGMLAQVPEGWQLLSVRRV